MTSWSKVGMGIVGRRKLGRRKVGREAERGNIKARLFLVGRRGKEGETFFAVQCTGSGSGHSSHLFALKFWLQISLFAFSLSLSLISRVILMRLQSIRLLESPCSFVRYRKISHHRFKNHICISYTHHTYMHQSQGLRNIDLCIIHACIRINHHG